MIKHVEQNKQHAREAVRRWRSRQKPEQRQDEFVLREVPVKLFGVTIGYRHRLVPTTNTLMRRLG